MQAQRLKNETNPMKTKLFTFFVAIVASICSIHAYETLTVAQALEIGRALETGAKSADTYLITGYVAAIESEYDEGYHNQCYWISDQRGGDISEVFYIYRGKNDNPVQVGNRVSIETKIHRYSNLVIENANFNVTILDATTSATPSVLTGDCGASGNNLTFQLNMSTWDLTIQGSGRMQDSVVFFPWQQQNLRYSVRTIQMPEGLVYIGQSAFENCQKVSSVIIPESVTTFGKWAFYNCKALTTMNMPESVDTIGIAAFQGCALTEPLYNAHLFCFLPTNYSGSYSVPDGIVMVISYSFDGRKELTSLDLPESVLRLGYRTFRNCTALQSITCRAINPPTSKGESFEGVDKSIPLYVPAGSISSYQTADEWREFTNIQAIPGTEDVKMTEQEMKPTKFLYNGQIFILRGDKTYTIHGQLTK